MSEEIQCYDSKNISCYLCVEISQRMAKPAFTTKSAGMRSATFSAFPCTDLSIPSIDGNITPVAPEKLSIHPSMGSLQVATTAK